MAGRRIASLVTAGAVALGGIGAPLWWVAHRAPPTTPRAQVELPWPYCAPDAERPVPSPTPWPGLETEPNVLADPAPAPLAELIILARSVKPAPAGEYPLASGLAPVTIGVGEVLWRAPGTETPGAELWVGAPAELSSVDVAGREILIGLGERRADGSWSTRFVIDADGPGGAFIGPSPFAERQTAILEMFRTWEESPAAGTTARELILAWNEEAATGGGPISAAWSRFVDRVVLQRTDHPRPGSRAWWDAAPPMCRSVLDAPEDVRRSLTFGTVWVRVPETWATVEDAALCLQISIGSAGCSTLASSDGWSYVRFDEAYAVPGEPVEIRIAHLVEDGAVSWVERWTVARIPYDRFTATGVVLVDLADTGVTMTRYADLTLGTEPGRVPVEALTLTQEDELLLRAPAPPQEGLDHPQGSGGTA